MQIRYDKSFQKQFAYLKPSQRKRLKIALALFMVEPNHPNLYNHQLTAEWKGHRSIAFGGDWRAHHKMVDDVVFFVTLGTHNQLYK